MSKKVKLCWGDAYRIVSSGYDDLAIARLVAERRELAGATNEEIVAAADERMEVQRLSDESLPYLLPTGEDSREM